MEKILIVDDDPVFLILLHRTLLDEGYQAIKAQGSQEAISAMENESFDLVITDLLMPDMDGIELTRIMLGIDPKLPIIIITGSGYFDKVAEALKIGAYDFVAKPFELKKICTTIKNALDYRKIKSGHPEGQGEKSA